MPPYESKMCLSFTEIWGNSGVNDTIKHSVIRNTTCQDKSTVYSKDRFGPVSIVYWTPVTSANTGSYKTTIGCLSFIPLVGQFNIFIISG